MEDTAVDAFVTSSFGTFVMTLWHGVLSAPSWQNFTYLAYGCAIASGRQTITTYLWGSGAAQVKHFSRYYALLGGAALVQFHGARYVIQIAGQIALSLPYVIDPINHKMKAMIWTFYDSSAQYATLLIFNIIRPIPQRIMVAVSFTNVR